MFTVSKYPHGALSWADCSSTDAAKATPFYAELMGWEMEHLPIGEGMIYTMYKQDGHDVAAISQMPPGMEMPSVWNTYITVEDVDAMPEKVRALGGTVISEPFDVFSNGRMMLIKDPTGAFVSLWQAKSHIGAGLVNTPGAMTWNELSTREPQKAIEFYSALVGWTFETGQMPGYHFIRNSNHNGRMNGGMIEMNEEWGDLPPHWMVYFSVKDIEAATEKVKALGGQVNTPISDAPGTGRFAVISDPAGAHSTLIQLEQPQPWED